MKKLVSGMLALVLGAATVCAVTACNDSYETYTVYAPDGAPALALANAVQEEGEGENFDFRIVDSSTIAAQVQGETPNADFCILPVNAAAKFLGTGETYQMLGTVTNGNMYLLTTGENPVITSDNLSSLVGKTVGVVQLANVPGLTLQAVRGRVRLLPLPRTRRKRKTARNGVEREPLQGSGQLTGAVRRKRLPAGGFGGKKDGDRLRFRGGREDDRVHERERRISRRRIRGGRRERAGGLLYGRA